LRRLSGSIAASLAVIVPGIASGQVESIAANPNTVSGGAYHEGVLRLNLEAREGLWRPQADDGDGVVIQAFAETGGPLQVPGPLVRVRSGTRLEVSVRNTLAETLVVYGLHARPGEPEDSLHVAAGAVRTVAFAAGEPGTYFYWGTTSGDPIAVRTGPDSQLTGAFIVDPAGGPIAEDRVFVMGLWFQPADSSGAEPHGDREIMTINGKSWPDTERLTHTVGDAVRWRWINATSSSHPMHLHGFYFRVNARGDWAAAQPIASDGRMDVVTELMLSGGTMDIEWTPEREGNWLFHCHFAFHVSHELYLAPAASAENVHHGNDATPHAMAGLVLGIHVEPGADSQVAPAAASPRQLRLLVLPRNRTAGRPGPHLRYALQEPGAPQDTTAGTSPTLLLRRGEPVAITIVNGLNEQTSVHWHGIELESFPDGVPGWSGSRGRFMPPIAPRDSFVAEFVPPRSGTFIYHSHANELEQMLGGLAAPLIVVDDPDAYDPEHDRVFIVTTAGAGPGEFIFGMVNDRRELAPIELSAGTVYRFRFINIGDWRVLFTLLDERGYPEATLVAKDGADLDRPRRGPLNLLTGPGETADFELDLEPGTYRLEFKQQLAGWIIPLRIVVRPRR
jgi:manganese oxidase